MRRLLAAVFAVSTAAIAFEILLMRMLSITQWHHFAWMVISLALLGYGASGTALALARDRLETRFSKAFAISALAFSVTMAASWVLAQRIPFNALEVVWDPRQLLWLGLLFGLFMVPFFFAASCIGMAFTFHGKAAGQVYLYDLLGAGAGAATLIALLFVLEPPAVLVTLCVVAVAASVLVGRRMSVYAGAAAWAAVLLAAASAGLFELQLSEYKALSHALQTTGSQVLEERSGPLGQLTVVSNDTVPFRHAPGLGIATRHVPPEQLAVFRDGGGLSAITEWNVEDEPPAYLGDTTAALAYHLLESPRVLVLGAGTGADVLQALLHGAGSVDAVELDPNVVALVRGRFAGYSGHLYDGPGVQLHIGEARGFAARSESRYDLVQIGPLDAFAVSGSGVQALNENYLYTVEAFRDYLRLLRPGGVLSVTRWLRVPPRDSLKLVNIAATALKRQGVDDPGGRLAVIRGWNTVTLLVRNGAFGPADTAAIRNFAAGRSFDTVHYPSMPPGEANRFNRLERPWFYEGVDALLGPRADKFAARYKFDITAATDERPYFFNFFRWPVFREAMALRDRGGAALVEWGYLVPAATLAQAALAGLLLILLPLKLSMRGKPGRANPGTASYFFLLGLAFLFVEIAFIQKFTLFLSHPLYAVAVVLASFLVFAGIGAGISARIAKSAAAAGYSAIRLGIVAIGVITAVYIAVLPTLFGHCLAWGDAARVGLSVLLIAPLALFMGMPFPLGLARLAETRAGFIPWAWGINGFASVISAALATLLAIELGFSAVLLAALLLYAVAALLSPDA